MSTELIGIRAKVERAEEHLDRFKRELEAYCCSGETMLVGSLRVEEQAGKLGLQPYCRLKALPPELGVTIGDFIHCLRSALDHLAWLLIPSEARDHRTMFPIWDRRPPDGRPDISGAAPSKVRQILGGLQPWLRNGELDTNHEMFGLRELSNNDKHRKLIIASLAFGDTASFVGTPVLGADLAPTLESVDILEGRVTWRLSPMGFPTSGPPFTAYFSWRILGRIRVLATQETWDFPMVEGLQAILNFVRDQAIPRLSPHIRTD